MILFTQLRKYGIFCAKRLTFQGGNLKMNFVFISPNFPYTYYRFCERLKNNGINVMGIGDCPYEELLGELKNSLTEYYKVNSLENYGEVYNAVKFFTEKYGKIDWLESNNEYWLEQDSKLRYDFQITSGIQFNDIKNWKQKSLMKKIYEGAKIKTARQYEVSTFENAKTVLNSETQYPVIIKPDIGVGSNNTWKIENENELKEFFNKKSDIKYVMEDFIEGEIYSYDAIINSKSIPIFESMTNWGKSIADIVNKGFDLSYYVDKSIDEKLKESGRKTVKAFNVKSRFVHLEFFKLTKPHKNVGNTGDFAALEVNMRPAGGYTADMMNFAHATDVYKIWADMILKDETDIKCKEDKFCIYASRKDEHNYVFSHEEILQKYGEKIVMMERMPELMHETMGCFMYTACFDTKEEAFEFRDYVIKKTF